MAAANMKSRAVVDLDIVFLSGKNPPTAISIISG
jgi:hypothetical protein